MSFDYTIVGGGPCGLTIALYLSKLGKNCCIIDKNKSLGGCHRVTRVDGKFTEHGPRVYSSAYVNVKQILKEINTSFPEIFTKYNFNISSIQNKSTSNLSFREKAILGIEFFKLLLNINKNSLKHTSVKSFLDKHKFSEDSKDYFDRICRLTDGAGSDRYNMFEFMQLVNQNFFYDLYQPKNPNDMKLFYLWEKKLIENRVIIMKEISVNTYTKNDDNYVLTLNTGQNIITKNLFLCIPPKHFLEISPIDIVNKFGAYNKLNMQEWSNYNMYINDIPVSFHWNTRLSLPKVWGFPASDWGLAFIQVSEYMDANNDNNTSTVFSTCITKQDTPSSVTGKTMHDSNESELITEVFRQLKISFPRLPNYDRAIIHPNVNRINNVWKEDDTAYVETDRYEFVKPSVPDLRGLYFVGTQNGNSYYNFTSMESAVTNSMNLLNSLSEFKNNKITVNKPYELIEHIRYMFIIILLIAVFTILLIQILKKKE
jgi:hypothetical protein